MAKAVYVTSMEAASGKSMISLGLMEAFSRHTSRVGYFRPVIASAGNDDATIELIRRRYGLAQTYEQSYGITTDQTRGVGSVQDADGLISEIMGKFEMLAAECDVVLVEGTDYTGASAAFEFELNVTMALNLGAPVLMVVSAHHHRPEQVRGAVHAARESLRTHEANLLGIAVNRIERDHLETITASVADLPEPMWIIPEERSLQLPSLHQIGAELQAHLLLGTQESLDREVTGVRVAAMTLPNLFDRLQDGVLLVTPGDRSDVLLAAVTARFSDRVPSISGVIVTGGVEPDPRILSFARGLESAVTPLLMSDTDTYETAHRIATLTPQIRFGDDRRIAAALGLFEAAVDTSDLMERIELADTAVTTPLMFEHRLARAARQHRRRIVLPEGDDDRILRAADQLLRRSVCDLTILGAPDAIRDRARSMGLDISAATLIHPEHSELRDDMARLLCNLRERKGMSMDIAHDAVTDVTIFGTLLVKAGLADGMVSGAAHTTADTVRPALQLIRTTPGVSVVSSVFFMCLADKVLVYGDCAVNPDPNPEQLADIAISSAQTAAAFGIDPYVAMLSYSTGASGAGGDVEKVRKATEIVQQRRPDLPVEGPIQYDAAVDPEVAASKLPGSDVAGQATVLIFPDLNTGNNTYKAVQRSARAVAIGPVLQGLRKPINDLSRGCSVKDIVNTITITAIQAQEV
ncbi:MAG: phosphate acetyltransferase [Candidatus Nanopelagicales bacterium]